MFRSLLLCSLVVACSKKSPDPSPSPSPTPAPTPTPASDDDVTPTWELVADGTIDVTTSEDFHGTLLNAGNVPISATQDGFKKVTYTIVERCREVPGGPGQVALTDCDPPDVGGSLDEYLDAREVMTAPNGSLEDTSHMDGTARAVPDGTNIEAVLQLADGGQPDGDQIADVIVEFKGQQTSSTWRTGEDEKTSSGDYRKSESSNPNLKLTVKATEPGRVYDATGHFTKTTTDANATSVTWTSDVHIRMRKLDDPNKVAAIIHVTPSPHRGDAVTFDGTASTPKGKVRDYHWTFKPGGDCPPDITLPDASKPTVTFRSLCAIDATLTIHGGDPEQTASTSRHVAVTPRPWRTAFTQQKAPKKLEGVTLVAPCLLCPFGRNVCTKDGTTGDQTSGHYIHHGDPHTFENDAYTVDQIHDGGPFDGWWLLTKTDKQLFVDRTILANADLWDDSPLYAVNQATCKSLKQKVCDFDALFSEVQAHERMHGTLVRRSLRANDPAKQLESLVLDPKQGSHDKLVEKADAILRDAESAAEKATTDDKVVEQLKHEHKEWDRPAQVLVRTPASSEFESLAIPNLDEVGETKKP